MFFRKILPLLILAGLCYFSFFFKLHTLSFRIWDESRLAYSAYEMTTGKSNLLVPTFYNDPDMWNTKPPLMIWAQAVVIKGLGFSELAVRLPAAICALGTAAIIFLFLVRVTGTYWVALAGGAILCTANGCLMWHCFRFGEYDSMLTLFITISAFSFFLFTEAPEGSGKAWLFLFFISLTLACLTKGIAGLLFTPAFLVYTVLREQGLRLLRSPAFYLGTGVFLLLVLGYYLLREAVNPGYLAAVAQNELGGRFMKVNEYHSEPFMFYFNNLRVTRFSGWYWIIPTGLLLLPLPGNKKRKRLMFYCFLVTAVFLLIISFSQTKLFWYDLPVYPLLSVAGALVFYRIAEIVYGLITIHLPKVAMVVVMLLVFTPAPMAEAGDMIINRRNEEGYGDFYFPAYCMRGDVFEMPVEYIYLYEGYQPHLTIYKYQMKDAGYTIKSISYNGNNTFRRGEVVLVSQDHIMQFMESDFKVRVLQQQKNIKLYQIL